MSWDQGWGRAWWGWFPILSPRFQFAYRELISSFVCQKFKRCKSHWFVDQNCSFSASVIPRHWGRRLKLFSYLRGLYTKSKNCHCRSHTVELGSPSYWGQRGCFDSWSLKQTFPFLVSLNRLLYSPLLVSSPEPKLTSICSWALRIFLRSAFIGV